MITWTILEARKTYNVKRTWKYSTQNLLRMVLTINGVTEYWQRIRESTFCAVKTTQQKLSNCKTQDKSQPAHTELLRTLWTEWVKTCNAAEKTEFCLLNCLFWVHMKECIVLYRYTRMCTPTHLTATAPLTQARTTMPCTLQLVPRQHEYQYSAWSIQYNTQSILLSVSTALVYMSAAGWPLRVWSCESEVSLN